MFAIVSAVIKGARGLSHKNTGTNGSYDEPNYYNIPGQHHGYNPQGPPPKSNQYYNQPMNYVEPAGYASGPAPVGCRKQRRCDRKVERQMRRAGRRGCRHSCKSNRAAYCVPQRIPEPVLSPPPPMSQPQQRSVPVVADGNYAVHISGPPHYVPRSLDRQSLYEEEMPEELPAYERVEKKKPESYRV